MKGGFSAKFRRFDTLSRRWYPLLPDEGSPEGRYNIVLGFGCVDAVARGASRPNRSGCSVVQIFLEQCTKVANVVGLTNRGAIFDEVHLADAPKRASYTAARR